MGARLEKVGDDAEAAGHRMSAGNAYLRAGMYYFTGERFMYPGEAKREVGRKSIELQTKGLLRRYPNLERVEVPFEGTSLPALFMKAPGASARAPTVVVFDGMDNCKEMSVLFNGLEFAARGWNTLAIDGPGQGESLRLREMYARHDYETAGTAAYDYVASRPEVDASKVVVMGYSFGGYYAGRVAAFEKRYAAGVAFAALHWDLAAWQREIKRRHEIDPKNTAQSQFHFRWIMGHIDDGDAAIEKAERFSLAGPRGADRDAVPDRARRGRQGGARRIRAEAVRGARLETQAPENPHRRRRQRLSCAGRQPAGRRRLHRRLDRRHRRQSEVTPRYLSPLDLNQGTRMDTAVATQKPQSQTRKYKGAEIMVEYLIKEKVPYLFGVCGHGNVGFLDAAAAGVRSHQDDFHAPRAVRRLHGRRLLQDQARARGDIHFVRSGIGQSRGRARERDDGFVGVSRDYRERPDDAVQSRSVPGNGPLFSGRLSER